MKRYAEIIDDILPIDICKTARKEWRKRKELLKTALEQDSLPVVPVAT